MVRVPLILLTGFLGAGKTTLLNALLARRAARGETSKIGVIVNELGQVGIDGALLGSDARQVELPGGCVCCVLGDELDRTLIELVDTNPGLAGIVLETTGVAEPLPIAWAIERPEVSARVRLAIVVTAVDAVNFRASRPLSAAVDAQVAYADAALVTKAELADTGEVEEVVSAIRTLASRILVRIGDTASHVAWLEELLVDPPLQPAVGTRPNRQDHGHVHDETCRDDDTVHGIDSVWITIEGVLDLEEFEDALAELPTNYVRIKGILRAVDDREGRRRDGWFAVHRVGARVSSEPIRTPAFEQGRAVALGVGITTTALEACVRRGILAKQA